MNNYFLDENTFRAFQTYIYELTGINYTEAKRYLLDTRVRKRVDEVGLADGMAYLNFLKHSPDGKVEVEELIDQISIHETSFFRHQKQIDIVGGLIEEVVDQRRQGGPRCLKIWSAACSSGEEPYTAAILVRERLGAELNRWKVAITGTDISAGVVSLAREGRYNQRSVQTVPDILLSRYFRPDPANPQIFTLIPDLAAMVNFRTLSLLDEFRMKGMRDQDVILCRNVLIYFDADAKKKVLGSLYEALRPGGYLVLGPSDSLHGLSSAFQRTPHSVYNVYQRPEAEPGGMKTAPSPGVKTAPIRGTTPASGPGASLRVRTLVRRLDHGLNDLQNDFNSALGKTVESIDEIAGILQALGEERSTDRPLQNTLNRIDRQIARVLLFLQVGDRGHQKAEALRAVLQELSDRLLGKEREAPDLKVRTTTFDDSILPPGAAEEEKVEEGGEQLSQDDIDALFN